MSSDSDLKNLKKYFDPKDVRAQVPSFIANPARAEDQDHHKFKEDPRSVDSFMAKEILKLSLSDRNEILEETHGLRCVAPEESPEMIRDALDELAIEIDKFPNHKKHAYLLSQRAPTRILPDGTKTTSDFVNSREFRLRFLRAKLFDARKAASCLLHYLEVAKECCGKYALFRPIRLSDFTKNEMQVFRKGLVQLLPYRDHHGRRIIALLMSEQVEEVPEIIRWKILLYMGCVIGADGAEQQRRGVVLVMWWLNDAAYQFKLTPNSTRIQPHEFVPMRASAFHICTPDRPFFRFVRAMAAIAAGRDNLSRIRFHIGESMEIRYSLSSHGINTDLIPITWTGNIKQQFCKQWIRLRQILEDDRYPYDLPIIDCPGLNDVIFRKGTSTIYHPGNVIFRSRMQSMYEQTEPCTMDRCTKSLVTKLIADIQNKNGRVLIWYRSKNGNDSWWTELTDKDMIYTKIQHLVKELKFSETQAINRGEYHTAINSSTSLFLQSREQDCCTNSRAPKRLRHED